MLQLWRSPRLASSRQPKYDFDLYLITNQDVLRYVIFLLKDTSLDLMTFYAPKIERSSIYKRHRFKRK